MAKKLFLGREAVRIDGVWRTVSVHANVLQLCCSLGPKAARNKSGRTKLAFGAIVAKVDPIK